MKRRDIRGKVTVIRVPPEPIQGTQPSAELTAVSERMRKAQNQTGQYRSMIQVEGLGLASRRELDSVLERVEVDVESSRQTQVVAAQDRGFADSLDFERRAREAGVITDGPEALRRLKEAAKDSERAWTYQRPR